MDSIGDKIHLVHNKVREAATRNGRAADSVKLVAVSKTVSPEHISAAIAAGQTLFGENKVQELLLKQPMLPQSVQWHLIGHLQSNKVRKVLPCVAMIESVDSVALAKDIDRIAAELGLFPKILLEVNVSGEGSKYGFTPASVRAELETIFSLPRLELRGLMTVPPAHPDAEASRVHFARLRELRDELEKLAGAPLPELSMGMSGDYPVAVEEGATLVRVGSAIFGSRSYP